MTETACCAPGGKPLAGDAIAGVHTAAVDTTTAIANGLGEMACRHHVEMCARSWQVTVKVGGQVHLLADGLDGGNAQLSFDEVAALRAGKPAP